VTAASPALRAPAVRHRGRPAWRILASVLTLAALLWGAVNVVNLLAHGERHFERTFSGPVTAVEVSTDRGTVRVIASDRDDVRLTGYVSDGLGGTDNAVRKRGTRLLVDGACNFPAAYWCTASYTLRVPRDVRVVLWSGSGDLSVSGLRSAADLTADHGDVRATRMRSRVVHADAAHGSIRLGFTVAPQQVLASSTHGDVTVVVPRGDAVYRVELSTDHGSTQNGLRSDPTAARLVQLSSQHGDVTARYPAE
jgi:hypothetical protein